MVGFQSFPANLLFSFGFLDHDHGYVNCSSFTGSSPTLPVRLSKHIEEDEFELEGDPLRCQESSRSQ
jgi:hypothetical protein